MLLIFCVSSDLYQISRCLINKSIGLNKTAREPSEPVQPLSGCITWSRPLAAAVTREFYIHFQHERRSLLEPMWNGIVLSCLMWHMSWSAIMPHYHRGHGDQCGDTWVVTNQSQCLLVVSNHVNQNKSPLLFIFSPYLILNSGSKRVSGPEADCRVCPEPRIGFRFPKMNGNKCCSYQN